MMVCGICLPKSGVAQADWKFWIGITCARISCIVGGSLKRLRQAQDLLWTGQVDATIALFADLSKKQAKNFCAYLNKHQSRIINYAYYQAEQLCSVGSGAVEVRH